MPTLDRPWLWRKALLLYLRACRRVVRALDRASRVVYYHSFRVEDRFGPVLTQAELETTWREMEARLQTVSESWRGRAADGEEGDSDAAT